MVECGVSDAVGVSDYLTTHATLAIPRPRHSDRIYLSRNIHAIKPEDIEHELINWFPLYEASYVDEMVSHFTAPLINVFDRLVSITCRRVSRPSAPWIKSGGISVHLVVHSPPLLLYFCTLEILPF